MSASVADRARLHCGDCGLMVFQCWVDSDPPPATCPFGMKPRKCPEVRAVIINGNGYAKLMNEPATGVVRALQQRLGYTEAEVAEMLRKHEADGVPR